MAEFATVDLSRLRPGDLLNLVADLRAYLDEDPEGPVSKQLARAESEASVLRDALEVARQLVAAVADRREVRLPYSAGEFRFGARRARPASYLVASLRDAVLMQAADDLDWTDHYKKIKRCRRQACGTVFYGRLNQEYCDHRCANAAAADAYRERKAMAEGRGSRPVTARGKSRAR